MFYSSLRTSQSNRRSKLIGCACLVLICAISTGCQSFNIKQATYSALRHEDCLRNEVEVYCSRAEFTQEYNEYEQIRNEFLKTPNSVEVAAESHLEKDPNETAESTTSSELKSIWPNSSNDSTAL